MTKNNNFVFVVLDALRGDHVNNEYMPFLNSLKESSVHVESLKVSSGFCERAEIMFGQYPSESGFVHAISPNALIKPYSWLPKGIANILSTFEVNVFTTKVIRRILWKLSEFSGSPMYPQRIPIGFLHKVGFTEDAINFEEYSLKIKQGLLYEVINNGFKVNWKFFTSLSSPRMTSNDNDRLTKVPIQLTRCNNQFLPVYIGNPDEFGHKYGPHSKELVEKLRELDSSIKDFYYNCLSADPSVKLCFIGDHGMEKVTKIVDLKSEIASIALKFNLIENRDYDIFLDSTTVRVWFYGKDAEMECFLSSIKDNKLFRNNGYFLDDALCKKENLPSVHELADMVWWAAKGIQIAPDYFHNDYSGKAGMHGYLKIDDISSGFVICNASELSPNYLSDCECNELALLLMK